MSQEAITRILNVEQNATRMHDDAVQRAAELAAEAEKTASASKQHSLTEAQQQAAKILEASKEKAEVERARIIAQAGADAQRLDTLATKNLQRAVEYVLNRIIGHE